MPGATPPTAANADGELVLHRWPARWGLPSLSPECVAVETYLRLAGLKFSSEACATPYVSPSGLLPALDQCADVVGVDGATAADGADGADAYDDAGGAACKADGSLAMARITTHLRAKVADLDSNAAVSESDRATLVAFLALAESRLATATTYYTWIDRDRFRAHTREAYGAAFPAPMSYILPWLWRRGVMRRHRSSGGSFSEGGEEGVTRGGGGAGAPPARPRRVRRAGTTPDGQRRAVFLWQNPDVARRARVRASELPRARARRGRASRGAQKAPGAGDVRGRDEARPAHTGPHTTPSAWWNADP
jgi:hypothetical protein